MRIKSIRLAWFRGAADPVALDTDCKSMVVYGQNGAGKSSFVDVVEYVVNKGKLAHLTHEYSGRNQEKAIPNTHTPADRCTELWIHFQNGDELNVKIATNGTHTKKGAEAVAMDAWDYRKTILRQDEVAEFIRSRKGEKYSALLPLFGLHELEVTAQNLRQLVKAVEKESTLAHKQGACSQTGLRRKDAFPEQSDEDIANAIAAFHHQYCAKSKSTIPLVRCVELETAIGVCINELSAVNQRHLTLRAIASTEITERITDVRNVGTRLAGSVEPLVAEKLAVLESADDFADKLPDDSEVLCPACGRTIVVGQFHAHIKAEQERLKEIIAVFEERKIAISLLIDEVKSLKAALAKAETRAWCNEIKKGPLKAKVEWIEQHNPEGLRQAVTEENLEAIADNCLPVVQLADQASKTAPPEIKDLASHKTLVEIAKAVFEARRLSDEISEIERLIAFIRAVEAGVRDEIRERSESVINDISGDIGAMWKTLHPGEPIEDVRLYLPEDDKAIDIALKFHGKEQDSPRLTLSEGYRNSLGLCIFLAMAKREASNDRPLFLDDVVVSLDRNHRGMIVELLEDQFAKRQVIMFTHDRDWYAELRQQLDEKRWKFSTLLPYEDPVSGIRWSHKTTTFGDARAALKDRPDSAGNDVRKIMDFELALVVEKLKLRLTYLRGDSNDKRTAHEFLARLLAEGKKCLQIKTGAEYLCHTKALDLLERADRLLVSWGNKSSHSFDVMRSEATKLIDACEQALDAFKCAECSKSLWFADAGNAEWVQCQCGGLRWRYGKG